MQNIADRCSPLVSKSLPNQGNEYSKTILVTELETIGLHIKSKFIKKSK